MNIAKTQSQDTYINQLSVLNAEISKRDAKITDLDQENKELKEQLAWFKRQIFGKRSERVVNNLDNNQLWLEGFENIQAPKELEKKIVPAHERRKSNRTGQDKITLPPDLPVKTVVIDIPEEKKVCQETGVALVQIGVEVSHKLAHEPGSYYVKEIIRPKYANPKKEEEGIFTAEMPDSILPKCRADESLLAEIITKKFSDHLPLYRIAEIFKREGVVISRKLLSQWVVKCGMALEPLYDEMHKKILDSKNIYIDETPVNLLEKGKCKQAYVWVVVGGCNDNPSYRIYQFKENRRHDNVLDILQDYKGGLHSDKYAAYQRLAERKIIVWYPCWSHIRRKFFEAEAGDPEFRKWILMKIRHLFMLEQVAWRRSPEERLKIRQEKEAPIIDELIEKIKGRFLDGKILPKSKFREALGYFCGLIPYIKNYTQCPFARLDNNVAERAIRPLAIGRKNWLFFGSPDGGKAGTILLSFVQTCRGLGINPREYLEDVMRRIMSHNSKKLYELLPDQWLLLRKNQSHSTNS